MTRILLLRLSEMLVEQDQHDPEMVVLHAKGDLNGGSEEFVLELEQMVQQGIRKVIVDCSNMRHISSHGIGLLIRMHHRLRRRGGDLKLAGVSGTALEALRVTRLNQVFDQYPTVDAARSSFASVAA